jgi:ribonucleotide reductase beta subunit family protein with ferritin-like domain
MSELLNLSDDRLVLFPIRHPDIFKMGKDMIACFWSVEELDFSNDASEFLKLDKETQHFIKQILAFFATADGIVVENLVDNFCSEVQLS